MNKIDCDGFEYFGAPRWAEFVLRDDALEMVWIMVRREDEARIIAAMRAAYGEPTHRNGDHVGFTQARTAWRFEPAEVLFYSPAPASWIEPDFSAP